MSSTIGAQLVVRNLEAQGVEYVFGIPGAKIDRVFDALVDSKIKTIVCRHEQNAAFIAGAMGRMTGKAGVVLVTSGPGCSNLVTGLATANSEGDPVVAFGGAVPVSERLKQTHQTLDTVSMCRPVTKFSAEIDSPAAISEVVANAFRAAESDRPGASFVSLPSDIMNGPTDAHVLTPVTLPRPGAADADAIGEAAQLINKARYPVLMLGFNAGTARNADAIRRLLARVKLPTVCTYQGAGVVPRDLLELFGGRVGIFHNQPADELLDAADLVVTVGYDPIEYDPGLWNRGKNRGLVHIDMVRPDIDNDYRPTVELFGDIAATLDAMAPRLQPVVRVEEIELLRHVRKELESTRQEGSALNRRPIHPLRIVHELQQILTDDVTLCSDMGSFHIWLLRYLYSFKPRQILISNGQQTLGVGLPWAIAACLARPSQKVISISGDGGFLFSAMELETAVRLKCNFVHLVWTDGYYDMVRVQEKLKYGRDAAVAFGRVDAVKYAQAFGATGMRIEDPEQFAPMLKTAMNTAGPVIVEIPVDYSDNHRLFEQVRPGVLH
ncbi:MAG TPA: acetolactate synthase AlsS [Candidatus Binataceae bacterium]|nr:acetolactate synthase AlsS [Candidatus Binataceae bacterium]